MKNHYPSTPLSICVINYNGEKYLKESLNSIFLLKNKFEEVILIDNASKDRSLEIVRETFPAVKIIELRSNKGPATARNVGFKAASGDRILFLDNDVKLTPDCPDRLMQALDTHPHAALAMPRVIYERNRHIIQYDGADSHFLGHMILRNVDELLESASQETIKIGSLITACFIVDRKKFGYKDLFDDSFFIYFEDHDFGIRAQILGHEILAVQAAHVYHGEGTSGLSLRESGKYSKARVFFLVRNRWQILLKNYELKTLCLFSPIFLIYEMFQLIGTVKKGWFRQWLKAFSWIFIHLTEILKKRRIVQAERITPDRKILKGGSVPFIQSLTQGSLERMGEKILNNIMDIYWRKIKGWI